MKFRSLKDYMPRGLNGRATLILLLPVVVVQIVVSIVFVQRLYEDVTSQMTGNISIELRFLLDEINNAPDITTANEIVRETSSALDFAIILPDETEGQTRRGIEDLSGRLIISTLERNFPNIIKVDLLQDDRRVHVWLETKFGQMRVMFHRNRVSARNPHQLIVLTLSTSILMAIIAYIFLRNQLRPIRRLARASTAFGKGQSIRYHPSGAIEVRAAGTAFLNMRSRIERYMEQRTLMLSGVSHDLRSPLTRFKLGLSMLEPSDEVADLEKDVEEMERLLDAFLDFAHADAGETACEVSPIALMREIVADTERAGGDVALVHTEGLDEDQTVLLRPIAIRRAIENLIRNAIRYGGKAEVSVVASERALRFTVEDPGPGIPVSQREEALKPFARLEPARNQNKGSGVGLGLSIAVDIARAHGGTLRLGESERLGGLQADLIIAR
ncbi:ATP-binding protein [Falsihalocynthiibacter sp. SS001]|uniref:ATP-binding protein n=1 Tax=Falsihalocynthiibacter sp. SS001 TaxID=3349698 RepID=UPI0036D2230D